MIPVNMLAKMILSRQATSGVCSPRSHKSRASVSARTRFMVFAFLLRLRAHHGFTRKGQVCVEKGGGLTHQSSQSVQTKQLNTTLLRGLPRTYLHTLWRGWVAVRDNVHTQPDKLCTQMRGNTHNMCTSCITCAWRIHCLARRIHTNLATLSNCLVPPFVLNSKETIRFTFDTIVCFLFSQFRSTVWIQCTWCAEN